jgi:hypothetical protein
VRVIDGAELLAFLRAEWAREDQAMREYSRGAGGKARLPADHGRILLEGGTESCRAAWQISGPR